MRTYCLNFVSKGYDRLKLGIGRRQMLPREQNMAQKIKTKENLRKGARVRKSLLSNCKLMNCLK